VRPTLAVAAGLIGLGVCLRLRAVVGYGGPPLPHPFNLHEMARVGGYSDIAHLYFRDHLWSHPVPYFDYRFEYPVLTGAFVWLASAAHGGVVTYFLVSSALLLTLGVASVWLLGRIDGANPWLLAAAPALAFYGVLNWDFIGVFLLLAALWLFHRERNTRAAAVLALGTAAKLLPVVVLPIVLALRAADRRWRDVVRIALTFAVVTAVVNLPVAIDPGAPSGVRPSWLYFFSFSGSRPPRATIWKPLVHGHSNLVTTPLLAVGLGAILVAAIRTRGRPGGSLVPASAASLLWVFGVAKVYSPQYALWIFAALAVIGVPWRLAIAFAVVDVLVFTTTFGPLYPGFGPFAPSGVPLELQWAAYGLRQALTVALAIWVWRDLLRSRVGDAGARRAPPFDEDHRPVSTDTVGQHRLGYRARVGRSVDEQGKVPLDVSAHPHEAW
jgi:glycosyl transferase family 87